MVSAINYTRKNTKEIQKLIAENANSLKPGTQYPIQWKLDETKFQLIDFKGIWSRKEKPAKFRKTASVLWQNETFHPKSKIL